ncbi:hypothetical protein M3M39_01540 [Fructilactobacillus hinvesii]|uniref:Uncharacterized protein n=2 Tax=Fructilactobacillus hinvesii TaxID=2940300 RepID=A0ABY5BW31_9LACO|nr:hypothetical protein M3M39_01540 [Fructilactobacillus hinvesii]
MKNNLEVEPVFVRMKADFGVRRIHLRGRKAVENDLQTPPNESKSTKMFKLMTKITSQGKYKHTQTSFPQPLVIYYFCNYKQLLSVVKRPIRSTLLLLERSTHHRAKNHH